MEATKQVSIGASVEGMSRRHGQTFMREAARQLRLMNQIQ